MRKLFSIALIGILSSSSLFAQTDTIFYDSFWSQTSREKALYFRLKPVKENDGYRIKGFYISGALQMSAFSFSDSEDLFDREAIWYHKSGQVMQKTEYKNGIKEGTELQYDDQGHLISKGVYKGNSPFRGIFIERTNSYLYKSRFKNGERVSWEVTDLTGESQAKIKMKLIKKDDKRHLEADYYGPNGDYIGHGIFDSNENEYEGLFVQYMFDPMDVLAIKHYSNGDNDTIRHFYRNGQQKSVKFTSGEELETAVFFSQSGEVVDTLISRSGEPFDGGFLNFLDGGKRFDAPLSFKSYRDGVLHGPYTLFYNNGQAWEQGHYVNGEKDGDVHFFNKDGSSCCSGKYKAGEKTEGKFLLKYSIGIESYENGVLKKLRHFYPDGELQQNSLADSLDIFYDLEGNELARLTYKNRKPYKGKSLEFRWLTGKLSSREHYEKGKLTKTEYYSEEEKVSTIQHYKQDGNLHEKTEYYPSGEKMVYTQYGESYDRVLTYYDKNGNKLGRLSDSRKKNGEKYDFRYGNIWKITHYEDNKVVYKKEYNRYGQVLYEIDYNGKARFYNQWGKLTGECTYVNGKPYDGTYYTYDSEHIKSVGGVKQGQPDGRAVHYKWNSRTRHNDRVREGYYSEGKEEGIFKEYRKGILLQSVTFKNGVLEGEAIFYDELGKELSRAQFKDDLPYEGTVYKYSNYKPYLQASIQYHNGAKDGIEAYFNHHGKPQKVVEHDNGELLKKVIYKNDTTYELNYRNSIPYEGVEMHGNRLVYYQGGYPVKKVTYRDNNHEQINFEITYDLPDDRSVKTAYYTNGMKKSVILFDGNNKDGKASFYGPDGKQLGVGHYQEGTPVSGTLVYPHRQQEQDYILVELTNRSVKAYVFHDGKKELSNQMQLDTSFPSKTSQEKVLKFLNMLLYGYKNDFSMSSY